MFKIKIFISIIIFSFLIIVTSIVKNLTREIEKEIMNLSKITNTKEKDLYESQLDYTYLTSPMMIDNQVKRLDVVEYTPMKHSKIFLNMTSFLDLQNNLAMKKNQDEK